MFERHSQLPLRRTRRQKTLHPSRIRTWRLVITVALIALASVYVAFAAISLSTSVAFTQDFTSMGIPLADPALTNLPPNFRVQSVSAERSLGVYGAGAARTNRAGGANVSPTASQGQYNFGAGTATLGNADRAVGFISTIGGTFSGNLYAEMVNNTGGPLTGLLVSYDVEKYRNGTNPAGYRYQLFYSLDGANWTSAGPDFMTSFSPDANNNGFATAPGATVSVSNKTVSVSVPNNANVYLAWNYSVTSGFDSTNAQALAIDNISIRGISPVPPTNPSGVGVSNPNSVLPGETSTLTVAVTPGTNPASTGLTVSANLSSIGGSAAQQFFDDGVNGGDTTAGDKVFTYVATVAQGTMAGVKSLAFSVTDAQARSGNGSIGLTVQQPPPPVDHLVVSQLYGGGGETGATLTHDYVELYNPTGISFNLAGWSLQYASAAGTSWTKQPLGGTIAPGEYFLVQLASDGANGSPLPVTANISSDINMSATTGKVALVSNASSLTGACPNGSDPDVVDFVGYGSSASCFEGSAAAAAPSNTNALFRKKDGGQDANQNGDDFQTGATNPRRTAPIVELGPWVTTNEPVADGLNAPHDATVTVDFSEPVDVVGNWFDITCASSGQHNSATVASYNNARGFHVTPNTGFEFGEQCTVTIFHGNVHDQDLDDSSPNTDTLFADHSWSFTVVAAGAPAPQAPSVHLAMGNPSNAPADLEQFNNYLMEKPSFALSYNRDKGMPNWVSWHLENDWTGNLPRTDTFRADPAVPADWYRVQSTDFVASGFNRGQMAPNDDRNNAASMPLSQETFLMTNVVPQTPDNQAAWADFENFLRTLLPANEIYIVAGQAGVGGLGDNGPATAIANGHVSVPAHTWKVALVLPAGENDLSRVTAATRTIAVIMPNLQGIEPDWHQYLTTVDEVEALTGYDFFANVPDNVENAIEAGINGTNPPGTENQSVMTEEDVPAEFVLNAVSPLATPAFTFTIISPATHGVVTGEGQNFKYTPAPNFHGPDSFTFRVNDGGSQDSNTSTVNISVTEVNDSPSANAQSVNTNANTPVAVTLTGNDIETAAENLVFEVTANPSHGSLSGSGANLTYTADTNYSGPDSFEFTVRDNGDGASPASTSAAATVSITVNDTIAPSITAPAPTSVNSNASGQAAIPNVVSGATASDNSGSVTVTQSPVAGTLVGVGTHVITLTATDPAGNTSNATTTFTVVEGRLVFSLSVSPEAVKRGKMAKLDVSYANNTSERLSVSFTIRYTSPCGSFVLDQVGPVPINAGAGKNANVNFHVPKTACTGLYQLTLEAYIGGVLVGTTTAELTVLP